MEYADRTPEDRDALLTLLERTWSQVTRSGPAGVTSAPIPSVAQPFATCSTRPDEPFFKEEASDSRPHHVELTLALSGAEVAHANDTPAPTSTGTATIAT
ncbi:uncharacterized protein CMC5_048000 [Chondromyces crocatus]|uniref:Uncharacterized protein n=1 Tax=Chondromyces crocatus TaxID=52 RepID=A0A0K1EIG5_CHOCO|nr:uncharacterized protein CMC5_048000 [Chondromyces crocatus]